MNRLKKIFIFFFLIVNLWSCAKDQKKVSDLKDTDLESQMIQLYNEGYKEYLEGDTLYAAQKFNEAELIFPQSNWAPKAALMSAYVYYADDYYSDAIYELERFLKVYKVHEDIDYAHFLLAMCYYENIVDEKKDLNPLLLSKEKFKIVIDNYPNTDFAQDSKFKIDLINDILASKEMYIGVYYLKNKKWVAAINRFKNIIENYETTIYVEEALHRLVETNYKIGLVEEAEKYANVLGYNYQSSEWYEKSYKIFNQKYALSSEIKKEKKSVFKKFKKLFQ